jgi:hypothetical protein
MPHLVISVWLSKGGCLFAIGTDQHLHLFSENASLVYRHIEASGAIEVSLHRRGPGHIPVAVFGLRGVVEVPGNHDMLCCHLDDSSSTSLMLSNHEGTTLLYGC